VVVVVGGLRLLRPRLDMRDDDDDELGRLGPICKLTSAGGLAGKPKVCDRRTRIYHYLGLTRVGDGCLNTVNHSDLLFDPDQYSCAVLF